MLPCHGGLEGCEVGVWVVWWMWPEGCMVDGFGCLSRFLFFGYSFKGLFSFWTKISCMVDLFTMEHAIKWSLLVTLVIWPQRPSTSASSSSGMASFWPLPKFG
uniref:Uncharacterized protein n=1 Tax=Setaria italica TaxID=4555 RepID=K3ZKH1_SETIT